jgi:flagellar FliL protein
LLKNKLFLMIISMLIVITLLLGAVYFMLKHYDNKTNSGDPGQQVKNSVENVTAKKQSPSQVKDLTVLMTDILTNLADDNKVVSAKLAFQMDSKKAKDEFDNLNFKVKAIINRTLGDLTVAQLSGSKGKDKLVATLLNKINEEVMTEGKVKQIFITDWIVQ